MSERKLTDAYWIEVGIIRERHRIIELVKDCFIDNGAADYGIGYNDAVGEILTLLQDDPRRKSLNELQRLAEETGEHENFDNPLIKKDSD